MLRELLLGLFHRSITEGIVAIHLYYLPPKRASFIKLAKMLKCFREHESGVCFSIVRFKI